MRRIFTLVSLLVSFAGFSQVNDRIVLPGFDTLNQTPGYCHKLQPCGMVRRYAEAHGTTTTSKQDSGEIRVCTRCINSGAPLYVVDGIPILNPNITELKTREIEEISVLKGAEAMAVFGSQGVNGVILITTKQSLLRKFIIKDSIKVNRIAGATVTFTSKYNKDTFQFAANDSGVVETSKLKNGRNYKVTVSAIGYSDTTFLFQNGEKYSVKEFLLSQNVKVCEEVIVKNSKGFGCRLVTDITTLYCHVSGIRITLFKQQEITPRVFLQFRAYPNPVQKGDIINIEVNSSEEKPLKLNLLNQAGQIMLSESKKSYKGINRFTINTDSRRAAGIYFLQIVYENGQLAASQKIIIQ
jgi:TonB-dependent SusC/RagA subfamily outer membrane receptor